MTTTRFPDGYVERNGVFAPKEGREKWNYNDGDEVEQRIRNILLSTEDVSCLSTDLRAKMTDWETLYHLTPRRANLLRPVEHLFKGRVLEVGAGCGAITRFLGETGAQIMAVEGSPQRASVAHARTRDLPNVTVISDNIQNVEFDEKFDVVTLIGVLEYARMFGDGADPTADLLEDLRARLKPNGVLLIAIENQLGLKYFAGAKEDHFARPFYGINDLYGPHSVVTFGKVELQQRLVRSGFVACDWYYPFPDYKLPTTVLTEAALAPGAQHDLSSLFCFSNFDDPQAPASATFSLEQAWSVIARNGLAGDFANSFLIACRTAPAPRAAGKAAEPLAWHYSIDRHPAFAKQATFEVSGKNGVVVKRSRLTDAATPNLPLRMKLTDETYHSGRLWSVELTHIVNKVGWTADEVGKWLRVWLDALLVEAGVEPTSNLQQLKLPGRFIDAMPFNMVRDGAGAVHFIDLEWECDEPLALPYLAYRALSKALWRVTSLAKPASRRHLVAAVLIQDAFRHAGLTIDLGAIRAYEAQDRRLQRMVMLGRPEGGNPMGLKVYSRMLKTRPTNLEGLLPRALRKGQRILARRRRPAA